MPTTEVTINNKPLSTMGVAMLSGAYAALLTPPSLKEFVENDDPTQNGIDIIVPDSPVVNERDVTLTFLIKVIDIKAKLKSTDMTIQEIAYSLNFPSASFFGKYFKRHMGMSPLEYRNS